jgi:hypothetical protein
LRLAASAASCYDATFHIPAAAAAGRYTLEVANGLADAATGVTHEQVCRSPPLLTTPRDLIRIHSKFRRISPTFSPPQVPLAVSVVQAGLDEGLLSFSLPHSSFYGESI